MHTEISAARWRALINLALEFGQMAPWQWMDDSQVVAVQDPASKEKGYVSIMGRESEFKAVAVYPGRQGWWSYLQISQEDMESDSSDLLYKQRCIVLSYESPANADADDRALLTHVGLDAAALPHVPSFRAYKPGLVPAAPGLAEVAWLELALPQALAAALEVSAGLHHIPENGMDKQGRLLTRHQTSPEAPWESEWRTPDPVADFSPPQATLTPELTQAARALPQGQGFWLVEEFYLPEPAEDSDTGLAFFPRALVLFDLEGHSFRGMTLVHPDNWPDEVGPSLVEMFMNQGERPNQLVVSGRETYILLKPLSAALGLSLNLEKGMDIRADLREAVLEMWREPD